MSDSTMLHHGTDGPLEVRVHIPSPAVAVVRPFGELDLLTAPLFVERVEFQLTCHAHTIIDMRDVTFIGSCGVRALLEVHESARAAGVRLYVTSTDTRPTARILELTGLSELLPLVTTSTDELVAGLVRTWRPRVGAEPNG
ncbi:STAS domain-containing protein [Pseudonocardia bannensis]|uniref:Anti-sigma factor antagonist n=1 Tax=Pseudonocardia bannensis TaxID=630973 RepID=A0A848DI69_9PSEU|nr:STAS domain-containing protein [Pseudonocardia bannensis]NMH92255.1 STAS domain-containing protein [Pseudonocardia bannensis]